MFFSSLLYGPVTLGRIFFLLVFGPGIIIGSYLEEEKIMRRAADTYSKYRELIPNRYEPNISVFFKD
jgi:hypothetical protein